MFVIQGFDEESKEEKNERGARLSEEDNKRGWCYIRKEGIYDRLSNKYHYPYEGQGKSDKYKQLRKQTSLEWFLHDERFDKYKDVQEKFKELRMKSLTPTPSELFIPPIINKNKALEDKIEANTKAFREEIRSLKEEVIKAKETNLIEKCITKEPNLSRPTIFNPPSPVKSEATEFAIECVFAFEEETGKLPIKKELWNLIRLHALSDSSAHVESTGKDSVKIWYTDWTKDQCFRFCKKYLK